ncbi:MAG: AP2 domain-containing protein [Planctomycetota bacterium]
MSAKLTIPVPAWLDRLFVWPVMLYRKYKYGWPFRRIYLGEGKFTIVDPDKYYWLNSYKWIVFGNGNNLYAIRLRMAGPNKTQILSMHREIMNEPRGLLVDHRNCNSLDNRRDNLRLATNSQNQCNRVKNDPKASSRYKGVCLHKPKGKWTAFIRHKGKRTWLGYFDCEIDAAKAYDEAARKYHKDFARLNFPSES